MTVEHYEGNVKALQERLEAIIASGKTIHQVVPTNIKASYLILIN